MASTNSFAELFKRQRRPGDLVVAIAFLALSVFLLSRLGDQTAWVKGTRFASQPAFWPTVSVIAMTGFGSLHLIGSLASPRTEGRWIEAWLWVRAFEFAAWFMAYVFTVPWLGYLPTTILFATALAVRAGYRSRPMIAAAAVSAFAIVVTFRSFLQVRIPGGQIYEYLPGTLRAFMLTYF